MQADQSLSEGMHFWLPSLLFTEQQMSPIQRLPEVGKLTLESSIACLERVGVVGISFMALLSGFASISSPWQNFSTRPRLVTETDITRKETGLSATQDMLSAKQSRLRALERKLADRPSESYFQKALGTIRPNADMHELKTLGGLLLFVLMLLRS